MLSPFPGMDPFLETNPIFHELHTQMLAEMQGLLQPQLRPKYVARLERDLSEGGIASRAAGRKHTGSTAVLARPAVSVGQELEVDELELRKQRRIVIYVLDRPRLAVTGIELLSPGNKQPGSIAQERYLEKRASALHGGLHWVEIDLLRGGTRPPIPVEVPEAADYLSYVAQATPRGWKHLVYAWALRDPLPVLPIPLLGTDQVQLDLGACFAAATSGSRRTTRWIMAVDHRLQPPGEVTRPGSTSCCASEVSARISGAVAMANSAGKVRSPFTCILFAVARLLYRPLPYSGDPRSGPCR